MLEPNRICRGLAILAVLAASPAGGCGTPFLADDALLQPEADERFQSIEAISLEDESRSPPVTPEEAADPTPAAPGAEQDAPASVDLHLAEIRRDALAHNLALRAQIVAPAIGRAELDEERARFEATFFARATAERTETGGPLAAPTDVTTGSLDPGVRIPLRTGGTVDVSLPVTLTDVDPLGLPEIDGADSALRFSISQPLLRGAGIGVATADIQVARFRSRQDEARTKLTAIRVLANVEKAYWDLYAAAREVEIVHERYGWALEQLQQAQRLATGGVVPEIETLRAEAGVARRLEAIIVAETERRFAETDLKRILNRPDLPLESPTALIPRTEPRPLGLDLDRVAAAQRAIANRMELLELELQLAVDAVNVEVARNRQLPIFALDFDYSFKGSARSVGGSLDDLSDHRLSDWVVGATVDIPLGNRAARARFRQAVLQRTRTLATRALRELSIRQEVSDALDQLERDWQRVLAARRETILVGRNFEAERRQFQAGVRTSTEVLEAADFLAEAQTREVRALADYQKSQVDLAFATGTVLGHGRVRWPGFSAPDED